MGTIHATVKFVHHYNKVTDRYVSNWMKMRAWKTPAWDHYAVDISSKVLTVTCQMAGFFVCRRFLDTRLSSTRGINTCQTDMPLQQGEWNGAWSRPQQHQQVLSTYRYLVLRFCLAY